MKTFLTTILIFVFATVFGQETITSPPVHDPVIIRQGSTYYVFCTGNGINMWSSKDMINWKHEKPVFETAPKWAVEAVPGFKNTIWAPDISYNNGLYYLYYAVSTFGKNGSCIGVATNKTLDPNHDAYKWQDHGKVVQSIPGRDLWNAIDPNLAFDNNKIPWLAFGSWWTGIKLVKLNDSLTGLAQPEAWYTIAKRLRDFTTDERSAGSAAIEAPFIFNKGKYYYLFVSFDLCCQGEKSTYKIAIGRSEKITGPYVDKNGVDMNKGGGSIVVQGNDLWYGVGHNAVCTFDGTDYIVFHGYDAKDKGRSKLIIKKLDWNKEGWPEVKL